MSDDEYEAADITDAQLEHRMYIYVLHEVIGIPRNSLNMFVDQVNSVTILYKLTEKEMKYLWKKPGFPELPIHVQLNINTWKERMAISSHDPLQFDLDTLNKESDTRSLLYNHRSKYVTNNISYSRPERPKNFDGLPEHWKTWKRQVTTYFSLWKTPQGVRYDYIIAGINRKGDYDIKLEHDDFVEDDYDPMSSLEYIHHCREIRQLEMYQEDKKEMFLELKQLCCKNNVWQIIRPYAKRYDVRGAWYALLKVYEGITASKFMQKRAKAIITNTVFDEDSKFDFDRYIAIYNEAYADLEEEGHGLDEEDKIAHFIDNMIHPSFQSIRSTVRSSIAQNAPNFQTFEQIYTWCKSSAIEDEVIEDPACRGIQIPTIRQIKAIAQGQPSHRAHKNPPKKRHNDFDTDDTNTNDDMSKEKSVKKQQHKNSRNKHHNKSKRAALKTNHTSNHSDQSNSDNGDTDDEDNASSHMGKSGFTRYPNGKPKHKAQAKRIRFTKGVTSSSRNVAQVDSKINDLSVFADPNEKPITARFESDSHADTCCLGKSWSVLADTGKTCTVNSFSADLPSLESIPIVSAATVYVDPVTDIQFLLVVHQALYFGQNHHASLISPNQLRLHGIQIDDIPKQFTRGESTFGIKYDTNTTIPFCLDGVIAYINTQLPTKEDIDKLRRLELTCIRDWDPTSQRMAKRERRYQQRYVSAVTTDYLPYNNDHDDTMMSNTTISAISITNKRLNISEPILQLNLGQIDITTLHNTLNATTQLAVRDTEKDIFTRYKTTQLAFKHRRLSQLVCYSDTAKPKTPSYNGNKYFQLTATNLGLIHVLCMPKKNHAHKALKEFVELFGIPGTMVTDNAFEERTGEWGQLCNMLVIEQRTTEPYTPKQNKAEREIQDVVKNGDRLMRHFRVPRCFWDHAYRYYAILRNHIAIPRDILHGRTPIEAVTGDTPDISEYITFHFYQPIWYHRPTAKYPESKSLVGRWLGPAHGVGQLLCYKIIQSNAKVVVRSTVQALDLNDPTQQASLTIFDEKLHARIRLHNNDYLSASPLTDDEITEDDTLDADGDDNVLPPPNDESLEAEFDPLIGSKVYMSRGANTPPEIGEVVTRKRDATGNLIGRTGTYTQDDTRIYQVKFPEGNCTDLLYNTIIENLYSKCDDTGESFLVIKRIVGITPPNRTPRRLRNWKVTVQWMDDTTTEEYIETLREHYLLEVANYIQENGLANEPAFTNWVPQALRQYDRAINVVKSRIPPKIQFGVELPRSVKHAFELDQQNGNTLWQDAIKLELEILTSLNTFKFLPKGSIIPAGYKCIPLLWIFAVKRDGRRRSRACAGGHVTDVPTSSTYSSVVEKDSVRISAWIEGRNIMKMWMGDITNAFPRAPCREKVYFIAGPEFGDLAGLIAILLSALYGLKTSGASFHDFLADILRSLKFINCKADPDVWFRLVKRTDGEPHYEYLMVYVDDILCISHDPDAVFQELQQHFEMKSIGSPAHYLGANVGMVTYGKREYRFMSSELYLQEAITKLENYLNNSLPSIKIGTPTISDFHPELDTSALLNPTDHQHYQSLIGTLQWLVALGRIDIHYATSRLSQFAASPRQNHLKQAYRVFAYLKHHPHYKIVFDTNPRDWSNRKWIAADWHNQYPDAIELIPTNMPRPLGKPAQINFWCDAAFATDLHNRRSHYGFIIFLGNSPIHWVSKQLKCTETSAYGAEFTALKIACEHVVALRYKLRMMGIPIDGPANGFVDNQAVVLNATLPESTLKKRHNFIAYHYVRELIATNVIRLSHEPGKDNIADILTKNVSCNTQCNLLPRILH